MRKLLVTGASGFLGWNLCNEAKDRWDVCGTVFSHTVEISGINIFRIDLRDFKELKGLFKKIRPDAVIHTAAATSPNYCQANGTETEKINVDSAINIAGLCSDVNIPLVFTSTDLVFDGLNAPYSETDSVSPINIYGEQKVLAEKGVLKAYPAVTVCRMPLMFGNPGPAASSFFITMLKALREGQEIRLFTDEFRTPVSGRTAAKGLLLAIEKVSGLLHLGGAERISRHDFGLLIMDVLGLKESKIIRCSYKDVVMEARRAPDVSLDSSKAFALGYKPLKIKDQLKEIIEVELR